MYLYTDILLQETRHLRRMTQRINLESKELRIDSQLTNFLQSLIALEQVFKKQGE